MSDSNPSGENLILVVDDIAENRSAVCRRLDKMGYRYFAVDGGRAALAALATQRFDLMLLDYMMPDMSGIDVLRELRQAGAHADLPVIMLTARTDPEAVVTALEAGANDYVTKPIDFDILQARMTTHLQRLRKSLQLHEANSLLDRRATVRAIELEDLQDRLQAEITRRLALEGELASLRAATAARADDGETLGAGVCMETISRRLRRLDMLTTRLATAAGSAPANPAILAEIAALARNTLEDLGLGQVHN